MSSIEENTVHPWVTWLLFYFEKILILCALKVFGLLTFWLLSESPLCQWQSYLREDVDVVRDLSSERDAVTVLVNKNPATHRTLGSERSDHNLNLGQRC